MSLRNRIAFYYTITTAFLIAMVFTSIYFMVEKVVYKQFDEEINNEVEEILSDSHISTHDFKGFANLKNIDTDDNDKNSKKINVDTDFVELVNSSGEIMNKSASL